MSTISMIDKRPKTEKSTFRLPIDLAIQLKHLAIDRRTTVTELLIEAIQKYLAEIGKTTSKKKE